MLKRSVITATLHTGTDDNSAAISIMKQSLFKQLILTCPFLWRKDVEVYADNDDSRLYPDCSYQ